MFLTVLHVMVCLVLVVVVLLQQGKGADIGAVFGAGASNTVFGSRGAGNFLTRLTTGAALIFMVTSLVLSYIANTGISSSVFHEDAPPPGAAAPAPAEGGAPAGSGAGGFEEVPSAPAAPEGAAAPAAPSAEARAPEAAPAPAGEPAPAPATP